MRTYGSVHTCFWESTVTQQLSDQAKLLALYLLTGPHSNMLGCFRLPEGYVIEDLKWTSQTVKSSFKQLSKISFLTRDDYTSWLVIHDFLKSNPIQNPKQGVGVEKIFNSIPEEATVFRPLIKSLLTNGKYLDREFINRLNTMLQMSKTVSQVCHADQEQNQNQEQNQDQILMSGKPDVTIHKNDFASLCQSKSEMATPSSLKQQAIEVLDFLNEKTGRAYRHVDSNLKLIIACLKSGATVVDCRQVIAKKFREWKADSKMVEYLRPATLFNRVKFEQYMGELVLPKEESTYVCE